MTNPSNKASQISEFCFKSIKVAQKRPLFIAVTGDSGSGKSYFSTLIKQEFERNSIRYSAIDHDSFLISRKDREPLKHQFYTQGEFKGKSHWEILENWFRMNEYDRVIHLLKDGETASYFPYRREIGAVDSELLTIIPEDFIIFDTTMQVDKMDFVILIEVSQENIIKRKLERDKDLRTPEQIIEMQQKVQGYCWERTKPKSANIVIDNNDFSNPFLVKE